ncbi:MAG TPA: PLP-dependent aminotransferase family protein [Steroidobacteraceae bacterium]
MSNQEPTSPVVLRPRATGVTLHSWLYDEIRTAILQGRLTPGLKLPSRKALARQYRISVTTVVEVSEKLMAHGYLEAKAGTGTYVRRAVAAAPSEDRAPTAPAGPRPKGLSERGRLLASQPLPDLPGNHPVATFRLDRPALDSLSIETWNRIAGERRRGERGLELLAHGEPLGFPPLRRALADHVRRTRGIRCDAGQVVVTSGTQHSLDLVARLLLDPGDQIWVEDPGYTPVTSILRSQGAEVVAVPVDARGIDCAAGRRRCPLARLAYVTPGCQFPLGVAMSHERRRNLLQWATEAGAWVFEDDHDSLLPADRRPQTLHSLDRAGSVIYSNSFNRMLFPSLRLGFLILPPAFIEPAAAALSITQRYQPTAEQAALADFIVQGHFDQHMRRMRELYGDRRQTLIETGRAELGDLMTFSDSAAGRQVVGWLATGLDEAEVCRRAAARQIDAVALASLTLKRSLPPALVFGIGAADGRAIRTAIRRLGRVLRVLAWQTKGARPMQEKVPAPSTDGSWVQTRYPSEQRPRPQPQISGTPAGSSPLAPALSPRYR